MFSKRKRTRELLDILSDSINVVVGNEVLEVGKNITNVNTLLTLSNKVKLDIINSIHNNRPVGPNELFISTILEMDYPPYKSDHNNTEAELIKWMNNRLIKLSEYLMTSHNPAELYGVSLVASKVLQNLMTYAHTSRIIVDRIVTLADMVTEVEEVLAIPEASDRNSLTLEEVDSLFVDDKLPPLDDFDGDEINQYPEGLLLNREPDLNHPSGDDQTLEITDLSDIDSTPRKPTRIPGSKLEELRAMYPTLDIKRVRPESFSASEVEVKPLVDIELGTMADKFDGDLMYNEYKRIVAAANALVNTIVYCGLDVYQELKDLKGLIRDCIGIMEGDTKELPCGLMNQKRDGTPATQGPFTIVTKRAYIAVAAGMIAALIFKNYGTPDYYDCLHAVELELDYILEFL